MEVIERVESLEETVAWFVRETRASHDRLERSRIEDKKVFEAYQRQQREDRIEDNKAWDKKLEAYQRQQREDRIEDNKEWDKKMEADRREWNKKWGETANRLGTLVEDVVAPNIEGIALSYFGCKRIDLFAPRIKRTSIRDRSRLREFDCIAICEDCIIVNDTKTTPSADKVDLFVEVLKDIFDYFPEAEGKRLIPIFSSLYMSKDLVTYLTRKNIYALGMGSSTMELLNRQELINKACSEREPGDRDNGIGNFDVSQGDE
ncbi:MAG: hypothetical protein HQL02_03260 [Nitrospirae bacterium]|nr:hypothetical protein [Nitrospirota bacterium]